LLLAGLFCIPNSREMVKKEIPARVTLQGLYEQATEH